MEDFDEIEITPLDFTASGESVIVVDNLTTQSAASVLSARQGYVLDQKISTIPSGNKGDPGDPGQSAYELWLTAGNTGTVSDYLLSLKGEKGDPGADGQQGIPGAAGTDGDPGVAGVDGESAYQLWLNLGNTGTETQFISSLKGISGDPGTPGTDGTNGAPGANGNDGRNPEYQFSSTHLQYRLVGDITWTDLAPIGDLTGAPGNPGTDGVDGIDGKNIELQESTTHIQWRVAGDTTWINLVDLIDLKGEQGSTGVVDTSNFYTQQQVDQALSGKSSQGHKHSITDINGLDAMLINLQEQITTLAGGEVPTAPEDLTITAGVDKTLALPTSQVTLEGQVLTGLATSWLWERTAGPQNSGTNFDILTPDYDPARTFTIVPDANGRAIINVSDGYLPGDRILLEGDFSAISVMNLVGNAANRIYIQNKPGQVTTIGNEAWEGGSWSEAIKFEGCKHVTFWGTDIESLIVTGSVATTEVGGLQVRTAYKNISLALYTENVRVSFLTVKNGGTGIWAKKEVNINDPNSYGTNTLQNLEIDNVIVKDFYNEALYIGHTADLWDTTGMSAGGNGKPYYYKPGVPAPDPAVYKKPIRWKNVLIRNTYVYDGRGDGIQVANSDGVDILNNEIYNWSTGHVWTDNGGIIVGAITDWRIVNNWVHDGWGDCFQIYPAGSGLLENNLAANGGNEGVSIRTTNNAVVTARKNTIANMASACFRVNGYYQGDVAADVNQSAHILEQNVMAKPNSVNQYIYKENGAKVTEGTGNNANLKQPDLVGVDANNYYLPITSPFGFRKGGSVIGVAGTPGATIVTPTQQTTLVTSLAQGVHVFSVTAKRADGTPATDEISVTVNAATTIGVPNAIAGQPQTITDTTVLLDGSASNSPNGPIATWLWTLLSGPAQGAIIDPNSAITQVTGLAVGAYVFQLEVTDSEGLSDISAVQINVQTPAIGVRQWFSNGGPTWGDNIYDSATGRQVLVYLPAGYDPARVKPYPVEINLHGLGERGSDINKVKTAGLALLIEAGQESDNVVVCPQLGLDGVGNWSPEKVKKVYDYSMTYINADPNVIVGSGLSEGSKGMLAFMIAYPGLIAAYAISSTPGNDAAANASLLKDIPGLWVAGTNDSYGFGNSSGAVNALIAAGGIIPPKFRVIYGGIHSAGVWNDKLFNISTAGFDYQKILTLHNLDRAIQAGNYVAKAHTTNDFNDYLEARRLVDLLPSGAAKNDLTDDLDDIYLTITPTGVRRMLVSLGDGNKPATGNYTQIVSTASGTTTALIDTTGASTGISFKSVNTQWDAVLDGLPASYLGLPANMYSQVRKVYSNTNDWRVIGLNNNYKYDIRMFHCEKTEANSVHYGFKATIGSLQQSTEDHHYNNMKFMDWFNISPAGGEISFSPAGQFTPDPNEGGMIGFLITEKTA